jgi:hypothetical protein
LSKLKDSSISLAELKKLKPVPVSKALHLLFDVGQPEMPPPPPTLPPINAKLIFIDKTNFSPTPSGQEATHSEECDGMTVPEMLTEISIEPEVMQHQVERLIKLEVPAELPPGKRCSYFAGEEKNP